MTPPLRQVCEAWFERVWAQEDASAIDEMFEPFGVAKGLNDDGLVGPPDFKKFHRAVCALLADIRISIDHSIEAGEWVSMICTLRAKQQGSDNPVTMKGGVHVRIEDGKIVEAHNHWDFIDLFADLGLMPRNTLKRALSGEKIA